MAVNRNYFAGGVLVHNCDDPHDTKEVESLVKRTGVLYWWDNSYSNRVNNFITGRRVLVGQRTHHEDLAGHCLKKGYADLSIPEEYEPQRHTRTSIGWEDPRKGKPEGELLRPDRFGPEQVLEAKQNLGSIGYAAQHQQAPTPRSGGIFKKEWIHWVGRKGGAWWARDRWVSDAHCRRFGMVDLAVTTKATSDYTTIGAYCDNRAGLCCCVDMFRDRLEGPDIVPKIKTLYDRNKWDFVGIEATQFQLAIVQAARRAGMVVKEIRPDKDKVSRAIASSVRFEAGQICFAETIHCRIVIENELLQFPNAAHDDICDNVTMACEELNKPQASGTGIAATRGHGPLAGGS